MGFILCFPGGENLYTFPAAPFGDMDPHPLPFQGSPAHLQGDRGQLLTIPWVAFSPVWVVSPLHPPFSNLPPTTVKFQTFCKRIGGLYHFVQRAEARKLASRESLTVLSYHGKAQK